MPDLVCAAVREVGGAGVTCIPSREPSLALFFAYSIHVFPFTTFLTQLCMLMNPPYWLFGAHLRILVDERLSHSNYDIVEGYFPPGIETPLHLHTQYDELIYVLNGTFTVYTDSGTVKITAGGHLFIPRNTPHAVVGSGEAANQALTVASPGGLSRLIRTVGIPDLSEGIPPGETNDMGFFLQLARQSGDVILGAPGARPVLKK
jgi:quercetin dioxygenase-like cupin family protein